MFCSHQPKHYEQVTDLLPFESSMIMGDMDGISILSIYKCGSNWSEAKYQKIKNQIHQIYLHNQFLLGKVKKIKGKWVLVTNSQLSCNPDELTHKINSQHIFETVVDPDCLSTSSNFRANCSIWGQKCQPTVKKIYSDETGNINNLSNFLFLRDAEDVNAATKIGIVYNQHHLIGDGCTAYNMMNMLNQDPSNLKTKLRSLDRVSVPHDQEVSDLTSMGLADKSKNILIEMEMAKLPATIGKAWKRRNDPNKALKFWMKKLDKNYVESKKQEYLSNKGPNDPEFISSNDVILNWLFTFSPKTDCNYLVCNLRSRLPNLNADLAGNYISIILLNHDQCQTAGEIRKTINNVLKNDGTEESPGFQEVPSHKRFTKCLGSMSTSWVSFYQDIELEGLELECQFPVFNLDQIDINILPGLRYPLEDCIITFRMNKDELGCLIFSGSGCLSDEILNQQEICCGELFA